jgi:DNA mismatch repair protein MutL
MRPPPRDSSAGIQTELPGTRGAVEEVDELAPAAVYQPVTGMGDSPLQVFDTYLLVPEDDRLLIIDQHALHERLTFDRLCTDLQDQDYAAQQLAVPLLVDVPPSHAKLLESNLDLFRQMGIELEPFGGNTFQITGICHLYEESKVPDAIYKVLDEVAQGELFDRENFLQSFLRLTVEACRSSVKAGDRLTAEERRGLLQGFRRLRPPYTCPHGRPIIVQLTQVQMEKSFRRKQ